jgi:2-keto-4-pentenoate hydratase/2-oxohepta-3-ene-1,7-dioic acid hydratase in catechol pathway
MKAENGYFRTIVQEKDGKRYDLSRIFATFHRQLGLTSLGFRREPILLAKQGQSLSEFWKYALAVVSQENDLSEFVVPEMLPLVCPLKPNRILAIGRNYGEHARELGNAIPEEPIVFMKPASCVIGPDEPIEIPDWVGRVDYEGELLVIIGKGGKNITEANAMDHVAAYSLFNDVTAREKQRAAQEKKQPWFLAKSLDTFGPLGPYLVTGDEVPDPHNLQLTLTVNGEMKQNGSTGSMIYSIPFLISYLSKWIALEEGDVIATGTPSGVGPLHPGDVVELTIEGLGTLRNPVVAI